jgi:hypothetical protein
MLIIIIIINFRLVNGPTFFEGEFLHPRQCLEFFLGQNYFFNAILIAFLIKALFSDFQTLKKTFK